MRTKEQVLKTMLFEKPYALSYEYRKKESLYNSDKHALNELIKEGLVELEETTPKRKIFRYVGPLPANITGSGGTAEQIANTTGAFIHKKGGAMK